MEKQRVKCDDCKGLGLIGTSVGSNHFRGTDYDCDVCHGAGYVELFTGDIGSEEIEEIL